MDFDTKRWDRAKRNYRLWWEGRLGRPLLQMDVRGRNPGRPEPNTPNHGFTSYHDLSVPADAIVDRWDYDLSCRRFIADGFPSVWPNFGPGVLAAFMGAQLENGLPPAETVWFHPAREQDIRDIHFAYDPDSVWARRIKDILRAARQRWNGLVQVSMTDLGGNLDVLATFRPGDKLLLDLYDHPDEVKRLTWEAHAAWWQAFCDLDAVIRPVNPGYTAWTPILSEKPYYILQCDFGYMLGPDMFDEFVKPELAASCRKLGNAFYHLDGIGQLPHLDSLLSIPELKGVQWVPGAGQPDTPEWPEVYRKIHAAGKSIQLWPTWKDGRHILEILAEQIGALDGVIVIGGAGPEQADEVTRLCARYGALD